MMNEVRFREPLTFSAGQYIKGHPMCAHPHGHTYFIHNLTVSTSTLDKMGMVVDFGVIKGYFKDCWDHHMIVHIEDYDKWVRFLPTIGLPIDRIRKVKHTTCEWLAPIMSRELRCYIARVRGLDEEHVKVSLFLSEGPKQGSPSGV